MDSTRDEGEASNDRTSSKDDPVLKMLGVGRELWEHETGDQFVERLRSEEPPADPDQSN
jgi:hypothetical protein